MTSGLVVVSLILIILGWSIQLYYSGGKKIYALSLKFVALYVVGCILLAINALKTGSTTIWVLNLITAIVAFLAGYFAKKARP